MPAPAPGWVLQLRVLLCPWPAKATASAGGGLRPDPARRAALIRRFKASDFLPRLAPASVGRLRPASVRPRGSELLAPREFRSWGGRRLTGRKSRQPSVPCTESPGPALRVTIGNEPLRGLKCGLFFEKKISGRGNCQLFSSKLKIRSIFKSSKMVSRVLISGYCKKSKHSKHDASGRLCESEDVD